MKRPRDREGVPRWNGPRTVCQLEAPLRVVWERERGDSPSQAKKNGSLTECRSTSRRSVRWCNQQLQGGAKQ
eukprot:scaffold86166_cov18-Phaeocystis_antarctica.AAC.1